MTDSPDDTAYRVLVVDDNPAIHDDFRKILRSTEGLSNALEELESELFAAPDVDPALARCEISAQRFDIDSAYQGDQAIELVRRATQDRRPYALAFVDVRMPPGRNGIETISSMWKVDPRLQAVICTAYSDHNWTDIVRSLGHSDGLLVLRKPFDSIEVLQIAHALAQKWTLAQKVRRRLEDLESLVKGRTHELETANEQLRREIAQRAEAENALRHLATHDALTGIPNRVLLHERMRGTLARARRHGSLAALLLLDLDNFKDINDTHGHAVGDELLRAVVRRLAECVRVSDMVARMGGDEFVVLLEDLVEPEEAAIVAQRILGACSVPFDAHGHMLRAPPSIGIAIFPTDCSDTESLFKCADLAMYQAKHGGRSTYRFYADGMLASSQERLRLRNHLGAALQRREFQLWYQPLHDLKSGLVVCMEALLRWQHPELGLVAPARFIPTAERSGLIVPIGTWVLRTACKQLREWRHQGVPEMTVAVNISSRQLLAPDFVDVVTGALTEAEIDPQLLELELTETAAMTHMERSRGVLERLCRMGVRLVIDDFGSGYSSLMRLKQLPFHALKIDGFFIHDIASDARGAAIVRSIVAMAHSMGLTVVAEHVETAEQLNALKALQWDPCVAPVCDRIQGFLLSHPLPVDAATTLLLNNDRHLT